MINIPLKADKRVQWPEMERSRNVAIDTPALLQRCQSRCQSTRRCWPTSGSLHYLRWAINIENMKESADFVVRMAVARCARYAS
jgi:hypothetical protein